MRTDNPGSKISLINLTKTFEEVLAVDDVSLDIESGKFITILGPSGSGKTTILKMVAGFLKPSAGKILINDVDVTHTPSYKRNVGMVFQNYALFPHMTVAQNIAFPLRMRKMSKDIIDKEIKRVLQMVQLSEYEKRHPKQLSGGQQQRIALARSLVFNPSVLLMDEPLGALDKKLREHVQTELKIIQKQLKITVIYVTHDQSEALNMSDVISVLNRGKIEQIGSPRDLYENPANLFVADFIGESNFIKGTVKKATNDYAIILSGSGEEIKAPLTSFCSEGSEIVITAHPEKLVILDEKDPSLNILKGKILEIIYLGEITKYCVEVNGERLHTKYHNRFDRQMHQVGDDVFIGWIPDDCKIVKQK